MRIGDEGATYASFPPNFQNAENLSMGYTIDRQCKKLLEFCKNISVWSNLDNVNPRYYDVLAANLRAPYYSSEYDESTRLEILKNTLKTYMFAGTVRAEDELINTMFADAEFVPWFKYDGKPFHFKIIVPTDPSEETVSKFITILERVKSARSIIDGIETKTYVVDLKSYATSGIWNFERMEESDD